MQIKIDSEELYNVLDAASGYREEGLINLKKNGILLRMHEKSNTALYACYIPDDVMEVYDRGELNKIGIDVKEFKSFVPKNAGEITITRNTDIKHQLIIDTGSREYRMNLTNPDDVDGVPDITPDLDLGVTIYGDADWLHDFIDDAYSNIFGNSDNGVYISAQDGCLHMWANGSSSEMAEHFHWEDFDDYDIEWEKCDKQGVSNEELDYDPVEDHETNVIMATAFLRPIKQFDGVTRVEFGNWEPMKIVIETDNGVKHSWMIPPRIPTGDTRPTIPERIIKDRSVV